MSTDNAKSIHGTEQYEVMQLNTVQYYLKLPRI